MEPEGSLLHSQVPVTCPYPEPAQSSPYPHIPLHESNLTIYIIKSKSPFFIIMSMLLLLLPLQPYIGFGLSVCSSGQMCRVQVLLQLEFCLIFLYEATCSCCLKSAFKVMFHPATRANRYTF